jgi:hypothetical protein
MVRPKVVAELEPWIAHRRCGSDRLLCQLYPQRQSGGLCRTAITEPWSNGQTEGEITKLELVKRQMYGRAKIDLLQGRLTGAA